jgi:CheY-like chemotaxis protein
LEELEALVGFEGGPSHSLEEFDLAELLRDTLASLDAGGTELALDPKTPRWLRSDPARMRFFLMRLIGIWNRAGKTGPRRLAVQAQEREAECLWVEYRLEGDGETERESASDPGLDPELALLLCETWVRKMGGRLHQTALPPGVLRFSLPFPLQAAPPAVETGSQFSVLLVEDHPTNQRLMLELLKMLGPFQVTLAANGMEAVRAHAAGAFDLVLMDYHLPGVNGAEAAKLIRAEEEKTGGRVPIIALTADAVENSRRLCLDAGMDDFLTKPVLLRDLSEALERWKGRKSEKSAAPA